MKKINNKGITLIELLVTISLIGILVGVSGDLLFTIFRAFNKSSTIVNIQEEGNAILNKIKTDAINASNITLVGDQEMLLTLEGKTIKYVISGESLTRITTISGSPPVITTENLFETSSGVKKYKLVSSEGSEKYSAFILKNSQSTPKLLVIYLTVIPFTQDANTPNDLKVVGANARLRTSIVLRGSYDRIN